MPDPAPAPDPAPTPDPPAEMPAPKPEPVGAAPSARTVTDIKPRITPGSAAAEPAPAASAKPASEAHSSSLASGGVLDLRGQSGPAPKVTFAVNPPPLPEPSTPEPEPEPREPAPAPEPVATPEPPAPAAAPAVSLVKSDGLHRLDKAAATPQSDAIKKFHPVAPSAPPIADAGTAQVESPMPNAVTTQVEHLGELAASAPADATPKDLPATFKPANVAAAALAIAIMGGYIWVHNYDKMALNMASSKAGIQASLPGFLPTSYNLSGNINYSSGQISLKFTSPSDGPLTLTQTKTDWDSGSLLENYVTHQSDKYLAVQTHGLTVYLYNGNQASFINKGLWYRLEGTTHLNQDQVLKIIQSL